MRRRRTTSSVLPALALLLLPTACGEEGADAGDTAYDPDSDTSV